MPTATTTRKAKRDLRQGYAPSTAAGEFVEEEMHHRKSRKHGAESRKQAVAIGLSKARRAGIPIKRRRGRSRPGSKTVAPRQGARKATRSRSRKKR